MAASERDGRERGDRCEARCRAYHRRVTPAAYAKFTRFALWALAVIVVTGAAVRLTGSGLGCSDWPTCSEDRFVADLEYHALVEFVNRLITGLVAVAVMASVLGSWRRRPRRGDLVGLSLGLVAGVLAQVVLGALLVKSELDPRFTMGHFLLSMVLLWNAAVLDCRARASVGRGSDEQAHRCADRGRHDADPAGQGGGRTRLLLGAVLAVGAVLLVTGTLVTGAGPHAGDSRAERLPLLVRDVARIHSVVAMVLLALTAWAWLRLRSAGVSGQRRMARITILLLVQGAVGYTQYFTGVPVLLVGMHITLATITWIEIVKSFHAPSAPGPSLSDSESESTAPLGPPLASGSEDREPTALRS